MIFRLTEALKGGGLEKTMINLGLNEGTGSDGGLTEEQLNSSLDTGEDEDCRKIVENVRRANQSLDAALPGITLHKILVHM